jgi:hypothetical protein
MRPRGISLLRGLSAGVPAGTVGGLVLGLLLLRRGVAFDNAAVLLIAAAAAGAGFGMVVRDRHPGDALFAGVAYGAAGWCLGPLTLQPLLSGHPPAWSVAAAQQQFASLLGYLLYGAGTGLAYAVLRRPRQDRMLGALLRGALAGAMVTMVLRLPDGLVVGPLLGLAQALETPHPSKGFGGAVIRGQGFGFLAFLAVLGGASRWSVEQARSAFPALLAYLLVGVAIALLRQCLDGLARSLSPERLRAYPGVGAVSGPVRAAVHGGVAGLLAAAMVGLLGAVALVLAPHGPAAAPSLLALCVAGAAAGVPYGVVFRRLDRDLASALGCGLCYAFLCWALGPLTLFPMLAGQGLRWAAAEAAGAFGTLVALLLLGACLGAAFHLLQAPYRGLGPRPAELWAADEEDPDHEPERQQAVTSAGLLVAVLVLVLIVLSGS